MINSPVPIHLYETPTMIAAVTILLSLSLFQNAHAGCVPTGYIGKELFVSNVLSFSEEYDAERQV